MIHVQSNLLCKESEKCHAVTYNTSFQR